MPFEIQPIPDLQFQLIDNIADAISAWKNIRTVQSIFYTLKTIAKIIGGRTFYCVIEGKEIIHTGWITLSSCKYYNVQNGDTVIGPIWSSTSKSNRGIGAWATKMAINKMMDKGSRVFFIDTSDNNFPCQKLIAKCEFGNPVATYIRRNEH